MDNLRVLVPSGVLGLGFDLDALKNGLRRNPNIICIDGGSTDNSLKIIKKYEKRIIRINIICISRYRYIYLYDIICRLN